MLGKPPAPPCALTLAHELYPCANGASASAQQGFLPEAQSSGKHRPEHPWAGLTLSMHSTCHCDIPCSSLTPICRVGRGADGGASLPRSLPGVPGHQAWQDTGEAVLRGRAIHCRESASGHHHASRRPGCQPDAPRSRCRASRACGGRAGAGSIWWTTATPARGARLANSGSRAGGTTLPPRCCTASTWRALAFAPPAQQPTRPECHPGKQPPIPCGLPSSAQPPPLILNCAQMDQVVRVTEAGNDEPLGHLPAKMACHLAGGAIPLRTLSHAPLPLLTL